MSNSDSEMLALDSVEDETNTVVQNLLPEVSRERYLKMYNDFMKWRTDEKIKSFSESVFLTYFNGLSSKIKPSTLWSRYSMLKSTLSVRHNVDLKNFHNLKLFLKRQSQGFKSTKSKVFTSNEVETFLSEAPDDIYLAVKVALIIGISGACRSSELINLTINDVENQGQLLLVKLTKTKTNIERSFVVQERFTPIVKKYQKIRPKDAITDRFFLNYQKGKCYKQVIGKNKISGMPKQIATYLNLPNCEQYTGHCYRRTSATVLTDSGPNLKIFKTRGGWKSSTVTEGYIEDSIQNKTTISNKLTETINLRPNSPQPATSSESSTRIPSSNQTPECLTFKNIQHSQICYNISNSVNIPNKNLTLNFTNCSNFSINFK